MMRAREEAARRKEAEADAALLREEEPPEPLDPLEGRRVHCWVLVVPNGRTDVAE